MVESSETGAGSAKPDPGSGWVPRITVPLHGLTRYLRVRFEVTDGVLRWEVPRTLLGTVPIGVRHIEVPVGEVRSARVHMAARPLRLLVGAACIAVPAVLGLWWLAVPMVVVGAWVVLVSFGPQLEVVTRAGVRHRAVVCFGHRIHAEMYAAAVNDLAEEAQHSTRSGSTG